MYRYNVPNVVRLPLPTCLDVHLQIVKIFWLIIVIEACFNISLIVSYIATFIKIPFDSQRFVHQCYHFLPPLQTSYSSLLDSPHKLLHISNHFFSKNMHCFHKGFWMLVCICTAQTLIISLVQHLNQS